MKVTPGNNKSVQEHTSCVLEYHLAVATTILEGFDNVWSAVTAIFRCGDRADSTSRLRVRKTPWCARIVRGSLSVRHWYVRAWRRKHSLKRCQDRRHCEKETHVRLRMVCASVAGETKGAQKSSSLSKRSACEFGLPRSEIMSFTATT